MAVSQAYENRVRKALMRFAKRGLFPFYSRAGLGPRGPRKGVLDLISRAETRHRRPDVTYVLRNVEWKYPSQIGFQPAKPPKDWQKKRARAEADRIIKRYGPANAARLSMVSISTKSFDTGGVTTFCGTWHSVQKKRRGDTESGGRSACQSPLCPIAIKFRSAAK
jgi:hypothetical protein